MKYLAHLLLLCVGLGVAFFRWIDLVNFVDVETGLVVVGSVWWRYGALLALVLLAGLASFMASRRPAATEAGGVCGGMITLLLGCLCAAQSAMAGAVALQITALLQEQLSISVWLDGVDWIAAGIAGLGLLCAAWLFVVAGSLFAKEYRMPAGGVFFGMIGNCYFYAVLIQRFADNQSSFYHLHPTIDVFSAAAVIWFTTILLRALYYPESKVGHLLYLAGLVCFYLCTCISLPQAIFDFVVVNATVGELSEQVLFAGFGLLGALYSGHALSKSLE